ncbi:MAG TPA: glutaredoxin family protein [Thermodesulfovibrionales bacterium]|nr:glutaredoxin family protein [Thermodesulfovibrionales bacterium]
MKEFLSSKKVDFLTKDIAADDSARKELVEKYHRLATPTIVIGKKVFVGFAQHKAEIAELLSSTPD